MIATATALAANLWSAWGLFIAAFVIAAYLLVVFPLAVAIGRAFKAGGEEFAAEEENARADAEWARYLAALGLTPDYVRAQWRAQTDARLEIAALPETRKP